MSKVIEKLDEFITPFLELVDVGNRNNKAVKRWSEGRHVFVKGLLAAQWIEGIPKNSLKGKFILVMRNFEDGITKDVIWNASQDSLEFHIMIPGWECIKHMRLPEYE
jgi:hypothetical protein